MVRIAVATTVWSRAARNIATISPAMIVRICRWVKAPSAPGAEAAARASLRSAALVRVLWVMTSLSTRRRPA